MLERTPQNSLAKENITGYFNPIIWEQMKGMAETFKVSGAFPPSDNAARLLVKMQAGYEMGMTPIESVKSFYFVNGTLNIFGAAVIKRLRDHGWSISYTEEPDTCIATIKKGEESFTDTFTFEEARKSGYTSYNGKLKPGWIEGANRTLKLRYGVVSKMLKTYVPEVLGSAVDVAEIAMDAAPLFSKENKTLPEAEDDQESATLAQRDTLRNLKLEFDEETLTKGEAKQLIFSATMKGKK